MVREICKDEAFLAQKAEPATADDLSVAQDLLDTLAAHKEGCVGMAANMIGINKRIIVFDNEGEYTLMFNPVIVRQSGPNEACEVYEVDVPAEALTEEDEDILNYDDLDDPNAFV